MTRLTLRDVPGLRIGHWTDATGLTGCTVVLAPDAGAVAGVDVRGSAPGTRETDLLRPTALVERIHAICLAGGSAFGLAAADGVMRRLAERGIGFATGVRPVPIVPAAILFDLGVGDPLAASRTPTPATPPRSPPRRTMGRWRGGSVPGPARPSRRWPDPTERAARRGRKRGAAPARRLDRRRAGREQRARRHPRPRRDAAGARAAGTPQPPATGNTTLVVIGTDANLDRAQCRKLAELGHDALAIGIRPTHTLFDGDVVFTMSTGDGSRLRPEAFTALGVAAVDAVGEAIERSVA